MNAANHPAAACSDWCAPLAGPRASFASAIAWALGWPVACPIRPVAPHAAAATISHHCAHGPLQARAMAAARAAKVRRGASGHSVRAMPHTAWATTATAASLSPCRAPARAGWRRSNCARPSANAIKSRADGSVKPSQASTAPAHPPRCRPMAKPTWLLVGPGRNWHSATSSA